MDDFSYGFTPARHAELDLTEGTLSKKTGDIFAMAEAFLSIESMSHKKLQKLCYYAKAWYLALYDTKESEDCKYLL